MNAKKIVNIINFVRAEDPRVEQSILYGTFQKQVDLCRSYPMPYTFLMQYGACERVRSGGVRLLRRVEENRRIRQGYHISAFEFYQSPHTRNACAFCGELV